MNYLNEHSLRAVAQDLVEHEVTGIAPDDWLVADLDQIDSEQRVRVLMFQEGARYERKMAPIRECVDRKVAEATTPDLVADWQRRATKPERDLRVSLTWLLVAAAVAAMVLSYGFGRVSQAAIDAAGSSQIQGVA